MQKTFFDAEYNPKIDYLITKNLLYSWARKFNEFDLRRAFKKKFGSAPNELKTIKRIRNYLRKHKLVDFKQADYEHMVRLISGEKYEYHYIVPFDVMNSYDLEKYVTYLKSIDSHKIAFACLSMMVLCVCAKENQIVIPYRGAIRKCLNDENANINAAVSFLIERTHHSNIKHDIQEHELAKKIIRANKEEFLNYFRSVKAYGIYGSFAMGKDTEYSDIDMLVVSDDESNRMLERDIMAYWHRFFNIEMDVKIVREDDIDQELTECMKKTLRMVA